MGLFEDDMKRKASDFRPEPREAVWDRIEQELDSKKRRRPLFWIWWLIPVALAGGGYLFFQQSSTPVHSIKQSTEHSTPFSTPKDEQQQEAAKVPQPVNEDKIPAPTPTPHNTTKSIASTGKAIPAKGGLPEKQDGQMAAASGKRRNVSDNKKPLPGETETLYASGSFENEGIEDESFTGPGKSMLACIPFEKMGQVPTEERVEIGVDKYVRIQPKTGGYETAMQKKNGSSGKKAAWNLVIGTGLHNISSNSFGLSTKSAEGLYIPPLNNTTGGLNNAARQMNAPEPGLGLMLGIERTQSIGKKNRWEWLAGLHYQYQTLHISAGAVKDSSFTFDRSNYSASYYYLPGSTIESTGYQHRVHLLTGAKLLVGGKQRKWAWQNGLFGGVVLASDYLVPLTGQPGWIPSKGLATTGYFGIETGIQYKPGRLGGGIFGQYNLSSSFKDNGVADQYWRGIELRISYKLISK